MQSYREIENGIANRDTRTLREALGNFFHLACRNSNFDEFDEQLSYVRSKVPEVMEDLKGELVSAGKSSFTRDDIVDAISMLQENFCKERIDDVKKIIEAVKGKRLTTPLTSINKKLDKLKSSTNVPSTFEKIINNIIDLLTKAINRIMTILNKNNPMFKKYENVLKKNDKIINNLEIEWPYFKNSYFSISYDGVVMTSAKLENAIEKCTCDINYENFDYALEGCCNVRKTTIEEIGGIQRILSCIQHGGSKSFFREWKLDRYRKELHRSKPNNEDILKARARYQAAKKMVEIEFKFISLCKAALIKAIGAIKNVKESMVNLMIEASTCEINEIVDEIFIIEGCGITEEFDSFMESRFGNIITSQ